MAVLLITHDLNLVKSFATRVLVMEKGVVVEEVVLGRTVVAKDGRWPVEVFKNGHQLDGVVTSESPLKVVVANAGTTKISVGASLVDSKEKL